MPRNLKGRSQWDLTLKSDTDRPIFLRFDRERFARAKRPFTIQVRYAPNEPGSQGNIDLQEWAWSNGSGGAGTSIETPLSYGNGSSEYGEWVWLRRKGVAMPAGGVQEIQLPTLTRALTSGQFAAGMMYGQDLWITTLNRTVVKIPNASHLSTATEQDFGSGTQTEGLAVFAGSGTSCLYVGEFTSKIRVWNGAIWADGEANTARGWLETPYWQIGSKLATGGASGDAGEGSDRLVGTNATGTGFYHVSGDPKVAANWSSLEPVGNGGAVFPIQRTVASNRDVWFGTGRGIVKTNEVGHSVNLTQWMELAASINNCAAIVYWNGLIWAAHESGLMVFAPDGTRIDLGQYVNFGARTGAGPIFGRPFALAPSPEGLYAGYYNAATDKSYIGCLVIDPDGTYRWSMAEAVLSGMIVTFLQQAIDSLGNPGLFIGLVDSTTGEFRLFRQYLPRYGDPVTDVQNGGIYRAATDWSLRLSRWNAGRPIPKTVRRLSLESEFLGEDYPDNTVDYQISADGAAFVTQGTATQARWSGTPTSGVVRATNLHVKLSVHNTTTAPVVISTTSVRYTPHPELTRITTYPVIFGEGVTGQNPAVMLALLEQTQNEGPILVENHLGRTEEGIVEPGLNETFEEESPEKPWVVHADVTISTVRSAARYDVGDTYDEGYLRG